MKLVLLLLAIYSLIFYQSYKIEKLKGRFINTNAKENLNAGKFHKSNDPGWEYQNAILLTRDNDAVYRLPAKKQPVLSPFVFY